MLQKVDSCTSLLLYICIQQCENSEISGPIIHVDAIIFEFIAAQNFLYSMVCPTHIVPIMELSMIPTGIFCLLWRFHCSGISVWLATCFLPVTVYHGAQWASQYQCSASLFWTRMLKLTTGARHDWDSNPSSHNCKSNALPLNYPAIHSIVWPSWTWFWLLQCGVALRAFVMFMDLIGFRRYIRKWPTMQLKTPIGKKNKQIPRILSRADKKMTRLTAWTIKKLSDYPVL